MNEEEKELLMKLSREVLELREIVNKMKEDYSGTIILDSSPEYVRDYIKEQEDKEKR